MCWEGLATADDVRSLAAALDGADRATAGAIELLVARILDARAAPALRELLDHPEAGLRESAAWSLGFCGGVADVPRLAALFSDPKERVVKSAVAALAELGGAKAADAIAAQLGRHGRWVDVELVQALAWLDDARALEPARRLVAEDLAADPSEGHEAMAPFLKFATAADREALVDAVIGMYGRSREPRDRPSWLAHWAAEGALKALAANGLTAELHRLRAALPRDRPVSVKLDTEPPDPHPGPRSVPKLALVPRDDRPAGPGPVAKIGGLPEWIDEPAWPVSAVGGPMVFYAQLPLGRDRWAYVFVDIDGLNFDPLSDGNAMVIQPGPPPQHCDVVHRPTGPRLFDWTNSPPGRYFVTRSARRPFERFLDLVPDADPDHWERGWFAEERGDWSKIGGTPRFLQNEQSPPGDGWEYAFQFTAWYELGDGAICYGFADASGRGAFLWQCH